MWLKLFGLVTMTTVLKYRSVLQPKPEFGKRLSPRIWALWDEGEGAVLPEFSGFVPGVGTSI